MRRFLFHFTLLAGVIASQVALAQTNNTGSNTTGNTTTGGQTSLTGQNSSEGVGSIDGDERFLRDNQQTGGVLGAAAPTVGLFNTQGANSPTGGNRQFGIGRGPQAFGQNNFNNQLLNSLFGGAGVGGSQQKPLRMPLKLGFKPPARKPEAVAAKLQSRLTRLPRVQKMGRVEIRLQGGKAILSGQVNSEEDRRLLTRLAMFEPGVSDVQNDLQVKTEAENP